MKTIKQAKSKNQIKNTKLFSVLFFLFIVLTSCQQEIYDIEEEGDFLIENSQNKKVNTVKIWFESNPKYNNFQILRYTKRIDWGKAKSFNNGKVNAIEIPLILKDNFKLTPKNSSSIN